MIHAFNIAAKGVVPGTTPQTLTYDAPVASAVAGDGVLVNQHTYTLTDPTGPVATALAGDGVMSNSSEPSYGDTTFPQTYPWTYDWLRTLVESNFDYGSVGSSFPAWDGTYADAAELATLFYQTADSNGYNKWTDDPSAHPTAYMQSKWYVCRQATDTEGWEGYGIAQGDDGYYVPNNDAGAYTRPLGLIASRWPILNYRNVGDVQQNPVYNSSPFKRRALVMTVIHVMLYIDQNPNLSDARKVGGYLLALAKTYQQVGDILTTNVKNEIKSMMETLLNSLTTISTFKPNGNMNLKGVEGAACAASLSDWSSDSVFQSLCIQAAKNILFDKTTGAYNDYGTSSLWHIAGFIGENVDNHDQQYNGLSFSHLVTARMYMAHDTSWDFLDPVISRIAKFLDHHSLQDPSVTKPFRFSPDADSGRVNSHWQDFDANAHDSIYGPATYSDASFYMTNNRGSVRGPTDASGAVSDIQGSINRADDVPAQDATAADILGIAYPWPDDKVNKFTALTAADMTNIYTVSGTAASMRLAKDPASTAFGTITFPSQADATSGHLGGEQWVSHYYNDWSAMVEGQYLTGSSYGSGCILHFYHNTQGIVVASCREPKGSRYGTTGIDKWRCSGIWGKDDSNFKFAFAGLVGSATLTDSNARTTTYNSGDNSLTVVTPWDSSDSNAAEVSTAIQGAVSLTTKHEKLTFGIKTTWTITSDETDTVNELWARIPIWDTFGSSAYSSGQRSAFIVEYQLAGGGWNTLTSTLVNADEVRVGHDWGSGYIYTYFTFSAAKKAKYTAADTTKDNLRVGLLDIDLHGNIGTAITLANNTTFNISIETQ